MTWIDDIARPHATVVGRFVSISYDSSDPDLAPDAQPLEGTVTLTPTINAGRVDDVFAQIAPVTVRVLGGEIVDDDAVPGARILATVAAIGVADWAWTATFEVGGFKLDPLTFKAPRDATVNLTAGLIPVKSQPYQIIEGASIVDTEVDTAGERMRFKMSDGTFTDWVNVPNGEPGAKGDKGDKGDPGKDGLSPTIAMGAVSTGTTADAWMTGTPLARELNLTLPRGAKGDKGDTPTWADLPGKPTTYPPDTHTHPIADVGGLADRLAALEYDSGWRDLSALLGTQYISGEYWIRRVGNEVRLHFYQLVLALESGTSVRPVYNLPIGFRPDVRYAYASFAPRTGDKPWTTPPTVGADAGGPMRVSRYGVQDIYNYSAGQLISAGVSFTTSDARPTSASLPGAAVTIF